ncbi:amidohydrolase/deacetylase family metallohydrolase [Saccharibacillus sp. CPCC 101409]|uniref:amidohydrolase/deacetylase family metallohydrolase n=1 Tax=Saccharibacillus sp. CPCC 101409 TaxID=3058041 RepID=UPI00267253B4|nr:amidohydrolase/deacetylase family metallohydrolase [Saccharibacillus sp. CPCC 101409]MDO3409772.1 amidohydrolase/deacetylase family metallohydrolase [Saccharibacillus sp. CPCC 101409]
MQHDLVIHGGTVIDPSAGRRGAYDIAVSDGKIAAVAQPGSLAGTGAQELDASGYYAVPGLIDLHAHVFESVEGMGARADTVGVLQGVTTVVDAGSSGEKNFERFLRDSVEKNATDVKAWLNISSLGLEGGKSELKNTAALHMDRTVERIAQFPQIIIGIKARMSGSVVQGSGVEPLRIAKAAARRARVPVMAHIGNAPPALSEVLDLLEEGDVVTHAFHGKPGGILAEDGRLIPEARAALDRGVLLDVGHGSASFSFRVMEQARRLGVHPNSISTDIYLDNWRSGPVYSQTLTMTKLLALGYSLEQVVEMSTLAPAKVLKQGDRLGTLQEGTPADITLLKLVDEPAELVDADGQTLTAQQVLKAGYAVKDGAVVLCK